VDLDIQGNQAALLGVAQDPERAGELDDGRSMLTAVVSGDPSTVKPLLDVRPNLHLIAAGVDTRKLSDYLTLQRVEERGGAVRKVLEHLARRHELDVIIIDSRPAGEVLGEVAMLASDYLAIPLKTDALNWKYGLETFARLYDDSGATARLLGAYLFASGSGSSKIQADTRRAIEAKLAGMAPVFDAIIPHSEKAAGDQSEHGLTADEYAVAAGELGKPWWVNPQGPRFAANSGGISDAYASLTVEIVAEMVRSPE
jgi:chromosome partitioning protein